MRNLFFVLMLLMLLISTTACQKTPAEFHLDSLQIIPQEAEPGEIVTISAQVQNIGGTEGTCKVTLKVDGPGVAEKTEYITVAPGKTESVSFVVAKDKVMTYNIQVNDLRGTFRVHEPAEFVIGNLVVSPPAAKTGQEVTVTANVANVGGFEGSYSAALIINGSKVETKELTIASGTTEKVTFFFAEDATGTYKIEVGELYGVLVVMGTDNVLLQLGAAYPELCQELLRLPDLKEIDDRDIEALEDVAYLALNPKYRSAFESMLDEGIKDKRKYCTPLEALLWIACDKEFAGYNPLEYYSLDRLINEGWKNTTTSKDYQSEKWGNYDQVVDRLNSPNLVNLWVFDNLQFDMGRLKNVGDPKTTFKLKNGVCRHYAMFATECLLRGGYEVKNLTVIWGKDEGHSVSVLNKDNKLWVVMDSSMHSIRGPYETYDEIANSLITRLAPTQKILNIFIEDNKRVMDRNATVFGSDP